MIQNYFNYLEYFIIFLIVICSSSIVFITNHFYRLSEYKGIKFFRDSFIYFSLAFGIILLLKILLYNYFMFFQEHIFIILIGSFLINYAFSMAGFSLVYSLVWKNFGKNRFIWIYIFSIIISLLSLIFNIYILFFSQIIVLCYGIFIAFSNYEKSKAINKNDFSQFFLIAFILTFIGYVANTASEYFNSFFSNTELIVSLLNLMVFVIFLIGILNVLKWQRKEKD